MTTATNITIPCTATTLETMIQHWKASVAQPMTVKPLAARPLSASEIAAFMNAASHDEDRVCGLLLTCTFLSGIPPLDLAAATWFEPELGRIWIPDEKPGCHYGLTLPKPALDMIQAARLQSPDVPWVFHREGDPIDWDDLHEAFDRIAMDAGILELSVSDLVMAHELVALFAALFDVPLTLPPEVPDEPCDDYDDSGDLCF